MAIELKKSGDKISLKKDGPLGDVTVNLNWNTKGNVKTTGFIFKKTTYEPIDLDLCCLYELKNGAKGSVQAIGKHFGSFDSSPFITLDGDDRTGDSGDGENMHINGSKVSEIKRILVFTAIYEGVANWKDANAVINIKCPGAEDVIVKLDEYDSTNKVCAIAMLENVGNTFSVEKLVKFFNGRPAMDQAYNWGLKWVYGTKD